jgi:bifunctional UDP-N-acetylglucosamine pyrophosphorylase/glucosamine-1-phosphate N-acetyltransferase
MQAIILAAGEGSRMRPLTSSQPKVMLPIFGKPLLEHIIVRAKAAGIDDFVLVIGYGAKRVSSHFLDGSKLGVKIEYSVQEKQEGTGHALLAAEGKAEDQFIMLNGDILPDTKSLKEIASEKLAVGAVKVEDPKRFGVFLEQNGYFKSVVEKSPNPPSNLANAGIYKFTRKIFDELNSVPRSTRGEYELTDGLNMLGLKENIKIITLSSWIEIGRPWDILAANESLSTELQTKVDGVVEQGASLQGSVSIGEGTIVRSGSYIIGPAIIGKNCDIGPNCFIRPFTQIGDNCRVGNAVEIKNSTIMDGSKVGHLSYVGDSVIGEGCNFGAGTICSNLRHDKRSIMSYIKGERFDSGRKKLGVIMGDSVKTGINTSIYPGTVIESGFRGMPAAVLNGLVRSNFFED